MQLYVRVPYYTDTYYKFTTSSLLKLLYYEFLVKYHEIFRLLYFQNTKKKAGFSVHSFPLSNGLFNLTFLHI